MSRAHSATPRLSGNGAPIIIQRRKPSSGATGPADAATAAGTAAVAAAATTATPAASSIAHSASASVSTSAGVSSSASPSGLTRTLASLPPTRPSSSFPATSPLLSPSSTDDVDVLPRSAHAERMVQMALSAEAARVLAASLAPPSKTTLAIQAVASASQRAQLGAAPVAPGRPSWAMCVEESAVRTRRTIAVPIAHMLTMPSFLGLFGDIGRTPEGALALFLAALWMYASATPPAHADHTTSVVQLAGSVAAPIELAPDAVYSVGAQRVGSVVVASSQEAAHQRRKNTTILAGGGGGGAMAARGAVIGNHWSRPLTSSSSVSSRPLSSPTFHFLGPPPEGLATVADQILIFLLDDLLAGTRDGHQAKRYFRAADRSLLDHWVRGHPEVVARWCTREEAKEDVARANGVDDMDGEGANQKEQVALSRAERREQRRKVRADKLEAKATAKAARAAAGIPEEDDDGEQTWNVSLKDSSDDDDDDDEEDWTSSSSSSSSSEADSKANRHSAARTQKKNPAAASSASAVSRAGRSGGDDALTFTIEENLFSVDSSADGVAGAGSPGSLGSPSGSGGGSPASRLTTRFLSCDSFRTSLVPVRLRRDRSGIWRVWDWYALLYGIEGRPGPPPIVIPPGGVLEATTSTTTATTLMPSHLHGGVAHPSPRRTPQQQQEAAAREEQILSAALRAEAAERDAAALATKLLARKRGSIFQMMQRGVTQPPYNPLSPSVLALASPPPGELRRVATLDSFPSSLSASPASSPTHSAGPATPRAAASGLRPFTPSGRTRFL